MFDCPQNRGNSNSVCFSGWPNFQLDDCETLWVKSGDQVAFTEDELAAGEVTYNYAPTQFPMTEAPGLSVFFKDGDGNIFHTYSCYARGLDPLSTAYTYLDLVTKGRDEDDLEFSMAWVRLHDSYED